jgi:hypothetical protein
MTSTTHTMVVKSSHKLVVSLMRWLFGEAMTSFPLHFLLYIIKNLTCNCMTRHMGPLSCTNVRSTTLLFAHEVVVS